MEINKGVYDHSEKARNSNWNERMEWGRVEREIWQGGEDILGGFRRLSRSWPDEDKEDIQD